MSDWPWDLHFEVAFDVDPDTVPVDGDFTDLSVRVHSQAQVTSGLGRAGDRSGSGTVDLNNRDRALDPTNSAATFNLVPMRWTRLAVTVDGTRYPLWQGYVENWSPVWPEYNQGLVDVQLVDAFAWLALQEADVDLPAQRSASRVTQILNEASWPLGLRTIIGGATNGIYLDAYQQEGANLLRVLEDTADAEDGELFVEKDGDVAFRHRHWRFDASSVATLGTGGMPVGQVTPVYDTQWLTNVGRVELENGDVYDFEDAASVAAYGPRVFPVRDLPVPWQEANALAQWVVKRFREPLVWLDRVTVRWRDPNVSVATVVGLSVGDLVTFNHTPPGGGTATYTGHVERLTHRVGRGEAETVLDLSPYHGAGPWAAWDTASRGWDVDAKWAP